MGRQCCNLYVFQVFEASSIINRLPESFFVQIQFNVECNDLKSMVYTQLHNIEFHQFSTAKIKFKKKTNCLQHKQQDIINRSTHQRALVKVLFTYNKLLWLFRSQFYVLFFLNKSGQYSWTWPKSITVQIVCCKKNIKKSNYNFAHLVTWNVYRTIECIP